MKRAVLAIMSTIVGLVLLLQYKTPAPPALAIPATGSTAPGAVSAPPAGAPPDTAAGPAPEQPRTLVGETIDTERGPVQVQVTITGAAATGITISDVTVLQYPNGGGRDQEINSVALPQLVQQALAVQSADIDMISGATTPPRVSSSRCRPPWTRRDDCHLFAHQTRRARHGDGVLDPRR